MAAVGRGQLVAGLGRRDELQLGPVGELGVLVAEAVVVRAAGLEREPERAETRGRVSS